jgi:gluconolactonase
MENTKRIFGRIAILLVMIFTASSNIKTTATTTEVQPVESQPMTVNTETAVVNTETAVPSATSSIKTPAFDFSFDLQPIPVAGSYIFTEGPATDANGNVYFTDVDAGKIYKWTPDGNVTLFLDKLNIPIGMMFDKSGDLIACEGGAGRIISIDPQGMITVLADKYNGVRFNEPNDLWIDGQGGIYFTDPAYKSSDVQGGEYVYYLSPDHSLVTRVIDDLSNPNGIVGTPDGTTLYVSDYDGKTVYAFTIHPDGTVSDRQVFARAVVSDGMTLDTAGNLYITTGKTVRIYDPAGNRLKVVLVQNTTTNVTFAGIDGHTLFITAGTAVYTLDMSSVFGK